MSGKILRQSQSSVTKEKMKIGLVYSRIESVYYNKEKKKTNHNIKKNISNQVVCRILLT
jgi:hypothetical protein